MPLDKTINIPFIDIPSVKAAKAPAGKLELCRSKVLQYDDSQLAYILASTMYKMAKSPRGRILSMDAERLLVTKDSSSWEELPDTVQKVCLTDFVSSDVQSIYLLEALGQGAEGKCFLACDGVGNSCVAKFHFARSRSREADEKLLLAELTAVRNNWKDVFGIDCIVFTETILLMPFFHAINWNADEK